MIGSTGLFPTARAVEAEYQKPEPIPELDWHTDYAVATNEAAANRKMVFIFFHDANMTAARRAFEEQTLRDPEIFEQLGRYVLLTQPLDASIQINHEKVKLLDHPAFREMHGRQGVAIIDFEHDKPEVYGYVVSTFPFTSGKYYVPISLSIILDLPPGTLTQRTMIYAVRLHPEKPLSTNGQLSPILAKEASQHSSHQAAILLQGHHNWDSRFQRISAKLPGGGTAQEVVAESWPNETLVEACVDCVDSWRQSPGHWGAVRSAHPFFGYDIKLGRNGIWYATGIFGRR
jgi:hypothetical protein